MYKRDSACVLMCNLCGRDNVHAVFSDVRHGRVYTCYHCSACDLFQTLGRIDPVSPDYIDLEDADLNSAHRYLQNEHKLSAFRQWSEVVGGKLTPFKSSVLDIGCGIGGFLDYVRSLEFVAYGFDASKAQVKEAVTRHSLVKCAVSLDEYLLALDAKPVIDIVTLWDVFEHVRTPTVLLTDIRKLLLGSGGTLFISVPSGAMNPVKVRIAKMRGRSAGLIPWEHVFYYTPKSLRRVIENAGFEVISLGGVCPYIRRPLTLHEGVRRAGHHALRNTSHALQIYVHARPRGNS